MSVYPFAAHSVLIASLMFRHRSHQQSYFFFRLCQKVHMLSNHKDLDGLGLFRPYHRRIILHRFHPLCGFDGARSDCFCSALPE